MPSDNQGDHSSPLFNRERRYPTHPSRLTICGNRPLEYRRRRLVYRNREVENVHRIEIHLFAQIDHGMELAHVEDIGEAIGQSAQNGVGEVACLAALAQPSQRQMVAQRAHRVPIDGSYAMFSPRPPRRPSNSRRVASQENPART
jgi:hypothetical protein